MNALDALSRLAPPQGNIAMLVGLIGRGIQASRTPYMHEAEGARLGLPYIYRLIDLDCLPPAAAHLPTLLDAAEWLGFSGLNITHPYKQQVLPHLHRLAPEAAAIGAVNTVVFRHGERIGYNTDCWGFAESFRHGLPQARKRQVLLLGAGGAGLAVARALLDLGVERLLVHDTDAARVAQLLAQLGDSRLATAGDAQTALALADGLVNATPVGMASYPGSPIPTEWLRPELWVADIIYFPAETALLQAARACGCITLPGAGMAIFQAVKAFELFSGFAPDPAAMARHFLAARPNLSD